MTASTVSERSRQAGVDPIETVHVMEDHDAAYDVWRSAGVRGRTLVHFDGHLDFFWLPERSAGDLLKASSTEELDRMLAEAGSWDIATRPLRASINIGNFINPAIREGIVQSFYWVIPDPFWSTPAQREMVKASLAEMIHSHPRDAGAMSVTEEGIRLSLLGCPLVVCPLSALPRFSEPVLLDIDVDYLVSWKCDYRPPYFERAATRPWRMPSAFLNSLAQAQIPTDLITIAYSVNGGYTPLEYKYFGDLLAKAFAAPDRSVSDDPQEQTAADLYRRFCDLRDQGNLAGAGNVWAKLIEQDPSYRSVFAFPGYREEMDQRWPDALKIYDQMIPIDPEWHVPHLGRGRTLIQLQRWEEAELSLKTARALAAGRTNATHWLGRCAWEKKDWDGAREFWKTAVKEDPQDHQSLFGLARLSARRDDFSAVLSYGRQCVAVGWDVSVIHRWMAWSAWKTGKPEVARREWGLWVASLIRTWKETVLVRWRTTRHAQSRHAHCEPRFSATPIV